MKIKLRSWNPLMKRMTYLDSDHKALSIGFQHSARLDTWSVLNMVDGVSCEEVVMLWSGLRDKNDKEIYEGDHFGEPAYPVTLEQGAFWHEGELVRDFAQYLEIKGNIYEY